MGVELPVLPMAVAPIAVAVLPAAGAYSLSRAPVLAKILPVGVALEPTSVTALSV